MPILKGQHTPAQLERAKAQAAKARAGWTAPGGQTTEKRRAAVKENIKAAHKAQAEQHKVTLRNRKRAVKNRELEVVVRADTGRMGPAMLALGSDRMRKFVLALLSQGTRNAVAAYKAAGYQGTGDTANSQSYRLMHDERIIAAIHEEAKNHVRTGQLVDAIQAVDEIIADPRHRDRARVALGVYDRAGLHALSEQKVTVERLGADPERVERIRLLLEKLGLDMEGVKRLMGNRLAPTVEATDAEYSEVPRDE
jgi:hypothetical protein